MSAFLLPSWDTLQIVFLGFFFFWRGVLKAGSSSLSEDLCAPNKLSNHLLHLIFGIPVHTSEKETYLVFFFFSFLVTNNILLWPVRPFCHPKIICAILLPSQYFCLPSQVSSVFDVALNRLEFSFLVFLFSNFFNLSRSLQIPTQYSCVLPLKTLKTTEGGMFICTNMEKCVHIGWW